MAMTTAQTLVDENFRSLPREERLRLINENVADQEIKKSALAFEDFSEKQESAKTLQEKEIFRYQKNVVLFQADIRRRVLRKLPDAEEVAKSYQTTLDERRKGIEEDIDVFNKSAKSGAEIADTVRILGGKAVTSRNEELTGVKRATFESFKHKLEDVFSITDDDARVEIEVGRYLSEAGGNIDRAIDRASKQSAMATEKLQAIKATMDKMGISTDESKDFFCDLMKTYAWTENETDLIRRTSNGEFLINSKNILFNSHIIIKELRSSSATEGQIRRALYKLDDVRIATAESFTKNIVFDKKNEANAFFPSVFYTNKFNTKKIDDVKLTENIIQNIKSNQMNYSCGVGLYNIITPNFVLILAIVSLFYFLWCRLEYLLKKKTIK